MALLFLTKIDSLSNNRWSFGTELSLCSGNAPEFFNNFRPLCMTTATLVYLSNDTTISSILSMTDNAGSTILSAMSLQPLVRSNWLWATENGLICIFLSMLLYFISFLMYCRSMFRELFGNDWTYSKCVYVGKLEISKPPAWTEPRGKNPTWGCFALQNA